MVMSDSEVKANVLQAKDQKAQIKICAELNNTCEKEIRDILKSQGVDLRRLSKNVKGVVKPAPAQESPILAIRNRIDSLLKQRAGIDAEIEDIRNQLKELLESV